MNKKVFLLILVVSAVIGYLFYGAHQIQLLSLRQHSWVFTDGETGKQTVWYGGPREVATYARLGNEYARSGEYELAVACYKKAIGLDPKFAYSHFNLGNIYFRKGDPDAACESYKKAIELKSDFCEAHENLGRAYEELRQYDCALACYYAARATTQADDKNASARFFFNLAGLADKRGNVSEAIGLYGLSVVEDPANPTAKNNLAYLYTEHYPTDAEKITEANKLVDEALAARPNSPEFLDTKGWVLSRVGAQIITKCAQNSESSIEKNVIAFEAFRDGQDYLAKAANLMPGDKEIAGHLKAMRQAIEILEADLTKRIGQKVTIDGILTDLGKMSPVYFK